MNFEPIVIPPAHPLLSGDAFWIYHLSAHKTEDVYFSKST